MKIISFRIPPHRPPTAPPIRSTIWCAFFGLFVSDECDRPDSAGLAGLVQDPSRNLLRLTLTTCLFSFCFFGCWLLLRCFSSLAVSCSIFTDCASWFLTRWKSPRLSDSPFPIAPILKISNRFFAAFLTELTHHYLCDQVLESRRNLRIFKCLSEAFEILYYPA